MFKVNNKKTISLLSKSSFQENKLRNLFAIIAIVLTVTLFTSLFTITSSLLSSFEESTMRQVGTSSHGSFKYLTQEQYDTLKKHPLVKDISYSTVLGYADNSELKKRPTEIRYSSSDSNAKGMFSIPSTGNLPKNYNDIATDTLVLDYLGIPAEIGQKVKLSYKFDGKNYTDIFNLVGFWEGDRLTQASQIWISNSYLTNKLSQASTIQDLETIGKLNADVNFPNSLNIENNLKTVILDSGYTLDEINYGVNWAYLGNGDSLNISYLLALLAAIFIIVLCGFLMISNVFMIGITKDIQYYGLIKAIGTTPKQIRKIISKQAMLLCIIAIPIGLLVGYLIGMLLVPVVMSVLNTDIVVTSTSPIIFISAILFSIVTVLISIFKPSRIAGKISPIEALRSTDADNKKKSKKSFKINTFTMAFNNIRRNTKKAILVTLSLSLGLIILNATYSMSNSFDMNKYLEKMITSDYRIGDVTNFNVNLNYTNEDTLSKSFITNLSEQEGIENMNKIYFSEPPVKPDLQFIDIPKKEAKIYEASEDRVLALENYATSDDIPLHVYGLDDDMLSSLPIIYGEYNQDKLNSGQYVLAAPFDENGDILYYDINDMVKIPDNKGTLKEYKVLGITQLPETMGSTHTHPLTPSVYLPTNIFLSQVEDKAPMFVSLDVSKEYLSNINDFLTNYSNNIDPDLSFISRDSLINEYKGLQNTIKVVGFTLSVLIALIGLMNFINTIVTSILSRKKELAMLQSIGMTNKQVLSMLIQDSIVYIIFSFLLMLTIGSGLSYLILNTLITNQEFMTFYFTIRPSLLCFPIFLIIAILIPILSFKLISQDSIVERLRDAT